MKTHIQGFFEFIQEQGVITLAVGFILGGAVTKVVSSLVQDIINPLLGIFLGAAGGLAKASIQIGNQKVMWGNFANSIIDFVIISAVVYFGIKILRLDALEKKKITPVVKLK